METTPIAGLKATIEGYTRTQNFKKVRDLLAFFAVVKFGGGFFALVTELGLKGSLVTLWQYIFKTTVYYGKKLPFVSGEVEKEIKKNLTDIQNQILKDERGTIGLYYQNTLPKQGHSKDHIFQELQKHKEMANHKWEDGKISGCVYHGGSELTEVVTTASNIFEWSNPLHCDVFPGIRKIESEVISMVIKMFHGNEDVCGALTSGGTESIIMACRAHKEWAYEAKGISRPHIVAPYSIHCAFDKACEYFGIRLTLLPVDPITRRVSVSDVRNAISRNTIMIAASFPSYPWGIFDDIEGLSALAKEKNIGLHVDCCLGSFVVAFMEQAGFKTSTFDFRLPGVTSISCDTHKYGFAPKGSSVIMYKNEDLRRYQYFCQPNWPGGIYASPTIAGSRPGQVISGCWAAMVYHGEEGYIASAKKIISTSMKIKKAAHKMQCIQVIGDPQGSVVAFESEEADIYRISALLGKKGWNLNNLQFPAAFHICVTFMTDGDTFIKDLGEVMEEVVANPKEKASGAAAVYGMAASIPDRSVIDRIARGYIDTLYYVDKK